MVPLPEITHLLLPLTYRPPVLQFDLAETLTCLSL